jgi:hypothetical protein
MNASSRGASLPFDHLFAELAAFPLASEAALANPVTHLDPGMSSDSKMGLPTARLWRAVEQGLLASSSGVSLTDLLAMRDECWFGDDRQQGGDRASPRSLQSFLGRLSTRHLEEYGRGFAPRLPEQLDGPYAATSTYSEARRSWMWLTFALPEDLLLAMTSKNDQIPSADLLAPAVRELLSRGFAETHLHVGAALDFRTVWSLLLARLAWPGMKEDELQAPGAALREGRDLPAWLLRCAITRVVLAGFLRAGDPDLSLNAYLYGPLFRGRVVHEAGIVTFSWILQALDDVAGGRLGPVEYAFLQRAYVDLVGTRGVTGVQDVAAAWACDPLTGLLEQGNGSPDQRLVSRTSRYLDDRERARQPDVLAGQLLWQTVRIRTILYRHLTQRPLTPGLPWFTRFYDRIRATRGHVSPALLVEAAAKRSGITEGLTSLEMRTSPSDDIEDMKAWLRSATRGQGPAGTEIGFVFHFIKCRSNKNQSSDIFPGVPPVAGAGTNADPSTDAYRYRYGTFYKQQQPSAEALAKLLHTWPRTLQLVRGLDLCSDELAVPSWVFKPLLTHVRQAARNGARYLERSDAGLVGPPGEDSPFPQPSPLRTTVHAGEDFSHLLTGLRNVHEAMEVLELREGDRIGHGLALGLGPGRWASQAGRVAMPLEERVLDLAWEWSWWTRRGRGADATRLAYLTREISKRGKDWFGKSVQPLNIEQLAADLADVNQLRAVGFPDRKVTAPDDEKDVRPLLLYRYLKDALVFRRGRQTIWVDPRDEVDALDRIGESLRAEIGRRGLAIEINPTSNLLIGDLSDLEHHPLWRISRPLSQDPAARLAVTIGSDDPLIFNSSLPMEYQRLYDALVLAGLSDAQALQWLDGVRQTGLQRRFTTAAAKDLTEDGLWAVENPAPLDPPPL